MAANSELEVIREQTERILSSGVLGRSRFYASLLEYLLHCAERGHAPKEIEIAAEVFNRGSEFDPSQDSMVRVYAHNLRQKLQQYYSAEGAAETRQIAIPKGEYRLALVTPDTDAARGPGSEPAGAGAAGPWARRARLAGLVAAGLVLGIVADRLLGPAETQDPRPAAAVAASALWAPLFDDDLPITVVVGDYFIFGEMNEAGDVERLVREFSINSSQDLDELYMLEPEYASRYLDLDLTYLPSSTAFAMRDFLRVLYTSEKPVRIVSMSDLDATALKSSHIVYVGYISALDKLIDFVFSSSELEVGTTYDELIDIKTGERFVSEAGLPSQRTNYRDYGLLSTFPGPAGNQFIIIAGTRDEGLMQTAQAISSPASLTAALAAVSRPDGSVPPAFEVLYEVSGFDRTNLDAMIVHAARLNHESIWTRELAPLY